MGFVPASGFSRLTPPQDEEWTVSTPTPASGAPSSPASARSDRKSPTKPAPAGSGAYQRRSVGAGAARCCRRPPGSAPACGHSRDRAPTPDAYRPSHTCARKYAPPPRPGGVAGDDPGARAHADGSHTALSAQHASPAASLPSSCPASSAGRAPAPIRDSEPLPRGAPPTSRRCGTPCRRPALRPLDRPACSAAVISVAGSVAVSPSEASCTVTDTMAPVSMSTPCSALWAKCVRPSFIFAIFASGSCGDFHSLFDVFLFFRDRSNRASSARVGVSTPDASANRRMNAS